MVGVAGNAVQAPAAGVAEPDVLPGVAVDIDRVVQINQDPAVPRRPGPMRSGRPTGATKRVANASSSHKMAEANPRVEQADVEGAYAGSRPGSSHLLQQRNVVKV